MSFCKQNDLLLNAEWALVSCKHVDAYVCFQEKLNEYLLSKYPKYYAGTQLYLDKISTNSITIVGSYYDVPGIYEVHEIIQEDIDSYYNKYWHYPVEKSSLLSFTSNIRVIPPEKNANHCKY